MGCHLCPIRGDVRGELAGNYGSAPPPAGQRQDHDRERGRRTFITVKGPELVDSLGRNTEKNIRGYSTPRGATQPHRFLRRDRRHRTQPGHGPRSYGVNIINALLAELDGYTDTGEVFVAAATNRLDALDPELLRGGRLERTIHVAEHEADSVRAIVGGGSRASLWPTT